MKPPNEEYPGDDDCCQLSDPHEAVDDFGRNRIELFNDRVGSKRIKVAGEPESGRNSGSICQGHGPEAGYANS